MAVQTERHCLLSSVHPPPPPAHSPASAASEASSVTSAGGAANLEATNPRSVASEAGTPVPLKPACRADVAAES